MQERDTLVVQVETPQVSYTGPITIDYAITGDYAKTGTVVIPAGKRTATFEIIPPENVARSEEHTSELQSHVNLVFRLLLENKNATNPIRRKCATGSSPNCTLVSRARTSPKVARSRRSTSRANSLPAPFLACARAEHARSQR